MIKLHCSWIPDTGEPNQCVPYRYPLALVPGRDPGFNRRIHNIVDFYQLVLKSSFIALDEEELSLVANQKKVLVEKLADKFQKKQMFFKAECCAFERIYSGSF